MNRSRYQDRMDRVDRIHRIHNVHRANRVVFNPAAVLDDLPVHDWRHFVRSDPFEDLNDREFMMHSQAGVSARIEYVNMMVGPQTSAEGRVWDGEDDP